MLLCWVILILIVLSFWRKNVICIFLVLGENTLLNLLLMRRLWYCSLVIILNIYLILCDAILYQTIILVVQIVILNLFLLIFIVGYRILPDLLINVWIGIFSSEKTSLSIIYPFTSIEHSLLWCWTFTLCKMYYIFYSSTRHIARN